MNKKNIAACRASTGSLNLKLSNVFPISEVFYWPYQCSDTWQAVCSITLGYCGQIDQTNPEQMSGPWGPRSCQRKWLDDISVYGPSLKIAGVSCRKQPDCHHSNQILFYSMNHFVPLCCTFVSIHAQGQNFASVLTGVFPSLNFAVSYSDHVGGKLFRLRTIPRRKKHAHFSIEECDNNVFLLWLIRKM